MIKKRLYPFYLLLVICACDKQVPQQDVKNLSLDKALRINSYFPDHDYSAAFYKNFYERFDKNKIASLLHISYNSLDISGSLTSQEYLTQIRNGEVEENYKILLLREDNEHEVAGLFKNILKENETFEESKIDRFINHEHILKAPGNVKAYWSDHWGTLTVFMHRKRIMLIRTLAPGRLTNLTDREKTELEKNAIKLATYYLNQF